MFLINYTYRMKLSGQIKIYMFFREANYYPNPSFIRFFSFLFVSLIVQSIYLKFSEFSEINSYLEN